MDEEAAGSEEILRLYEARRAARRAKVLPAGALAAAEAGDEEAPAPVAGQPSESSPPNPPGPSSPSPAASDPWQAVGDERGEPQSGPEAPAPVGSALQVRRPAALPTMRPAVEGGGVALSAGSPALNLSDRLLTDRFIATRGSRSGLAIGSALAFTGLAAVVVDQALLSRGVVVTPVGSDLTSLGVVAAALGLLLAVLFLFVPRRRSLRVRLAATQREEWVRVQAEAAALRRRSLAGAAVAAGGLAAAAIAYSVLTQPASGYAALVLLLAAAAGLGTMLWAVARRGLAQRLYVQTLVLQRLEQTGLGPAAEADPRIAPVLRSLDKLLGALPESAVRRFLASDEATAYLDLIDELGNGRTDGNDGTERKDGKGGGHGR